MKQSTTYTIHPVVLNYASKIKRVILLKWFYEESLYTLLSYSLILETQDVQQKNYITQKFHYIKGMLWQLQLPK